MRPGVKQAGWLALAALVASLSLGARPASAQMLVTSVQNLQYGLLTPGVPATVVPTDVARRAQLTLEAQRGTYSVTFVLPSSLTDAAGEQVPLVFGPGSAAVEHKNSVTAFDPAVGTQVSMNPGHRLASIYLGGQAQPAPGQPAGFYTATIVLMVVQTGT